MKDPQDPACGHSLTEGGGGEATGPSSEISATLSHSPLPAVCNSAKAAHGLLGCTWSPDLWKAKNTEV